MEKKRILIVFSLFLLKELCQNLNAGTSLDQANLPGWGVGCFGRPPEEAELFFRNCQKEPAAGLGVKQKHSLVFAYFLRELDLRFKVESVIAGTARKGVD